MHCDVNMGQVRGQGLVTSTFVKTSVAGGQRVAGYWGEWGQPRLLFVRLATREETSDRIPVIDERREWK